MAETRLWVCDTRTDAWHYDGSISQSKFDGTDIVYVMPSGDEMYSSFISVIYNDVDEKIYFTCQDCLHGIYRTDINGSGIETLLENFISGIQFIGPYGISLDVENNYLYFTEEDTGRVNRMGIDLPFGMTPSGRTDIETILTGITGAINISVDTDNSRLIGIARGAWNGPSNGKYIYKCDLDGSRFYKLVSGDMSWPGGLVLDSENELMYWVDAQEQTIEVCDYDGGHREIIYEPSGEATIGLAVDVSGEMIYWTDYYEGAIHATTINGVGDTIIRDDLSKPWNLNIMPGNPGPPEAMPGKWIPQTTFYAKLLPGHTPEIKGKFEEAGADSITIDVWDINTEELVELTSNVCTRQGVSSFWTWSTANFYDLDNGDYHFLCRMTSSESEVVYVELFLDVRG